jgi:hypothetical protein
MNLGEILQASERLGLGDRDVVASLTEDRNALLIVVELRPGRPVVERFEDRRRAPRTATPNGVEPRVDYNERPPAPSV